MKKSHPMRAIAVCLLAAFILLTSAPTGLFGINAEAANVSGTDIVAYAKTFIGYPYGHGYGPDVFDCCGLVQYVFKHFGISLPWNCYDYKDHGTVVSESEAKPGDLVVWHGKHVGIYSKSGYVINALNTKYGVVESKLSNLTNGTPSYYVRVKGVGGVQVTFNANGGTASTSKGVFTEGNSYGNEFPSALRNGYTFEGWYTAANGGERVYRHSKVTAGNKTFYAHWIPNQTGVLEVGHVYRIINKLSGMCWCAKEDENHENVIQVPCGSTTDNSELWRVIRADQDGYYKLENLHGRKALDMNNASDKYAYHNVLQIYNENDNSDAQYFSIIRRDSYAGHSGMYTIHSKNTGRVLDVKGGSSESGAVINQWDYHTNDNQLFYFEEVEEREVRFYDNLNNNYIASPAEEYAFIGQTTPIDHYVTRDPETVTVTLNPSEDGITIRSLKAGTVSKSLTFETTVAGSYNYNFNELNAGTMELHFKAKSSVAGAKMTFRWGYAKTDQRVEVSLTTAWKDYTVVLERDRNSGRNLHPFIDRSCTIEMKDIALYDSGVSGSIGGTDAYTVQTVTGNVNEADSCFAPMPTTTKEGYAFDGWYTKRVGGVKVADGNSYYDVSSLAGSQKLYAHWIKQEHVHSITQTVVAPTCEQYGYLLTMCSACDYRIESDIQPPTGHAFGSWEPVDSDIHQRVCQNDSTHIEREAHEWDDGEITTEPTSTAAGVKTYTCTVCQAEKTEPVPPLGDDPAGENDPQFILYTETAKAGQLVDIKVEMLNNPGIIATALHVFYDSAVLRLVDVTDGGLLGASSFSPGKDYTAIPYTVLWEDGLAPQNYAGNGILVTFTFEVMENAPLGLTPITLSYSKNSTLNVDVEEVEFALVNGGVEVSDRTPGDVNNDGLIDLKDVVILRRFLSGGWDVTIDESNSDVNGDRVVDLKDVVILRRFLSGGWNVTLQ